MCPICQNFNGVHNRYCPKQPDAFPLTADDYKVIKHEDKD